MLFSLACRGDFERGDFDIQFKGDIHGPAETVEQVLSVGDAPVLVINSENGRISVEAGADHQVTVEAQIKRPDDVDFDISQEGDTITITARAREDFFSFHSSPGAEIDVTAPSNTQIDLRTSNGSIEVEGIKESGSIRTSNGKIVLNDVSGAFEARTSNGSIEFEGELTPGGNNELRTSNGSVSVELTDDSPSVRLDATTSNGKVDSKLPITTTSRDNNHISGTIGDGEAKLVVRTSNGSVTIR